jgi:hypothetical protein
MITVGRVGALRDLSRASPPDLHGRRGSPESIKCHNPPPRPEHGRQWPQFLDQGHPLRTALLLSLAVSRVRRRRRIHLLSLRRELGARPRADLQPRRACRGLHEFRMGRMASPRKPLRNRDRSRGQADGNDSRHGDLSHLLSRYQPCDCRRYRKLLQALTKLRRLSEGILRLRKTALRITEAEASLGMTEWSAYASTSRNSHRSSVASL